MPRNITVTFADGTNHVYQNAPDSVTPDQVQSRAEKQFAKTVTGIDGGAQAASKPETTIGQDIKQGAGNLLAGAARGAGSIGATLLVPMDYAEDFIKGDRGKNLSSLITGKELPSRNAERRASMDAALASMGAEPESMLYQGGKLAGEIAGTAGAGGAAANLVTRAAPALATKAAPLLSAVRSGGMIAPGAGIGTRAAGGAISGGLSAGLANPEDALAGTVVGGAAPAVIKTAGAAGNLVGQGIRKAVGGAVSPEVAQLAQRAKQLGVDIPADRLVDSRPLNAVVAGLNYVPFSGRAATEDLMTSQLNRAVSRTFGQDSPNVTGALRKAQDQLGAEFDHTLRNNGVKFDEKLLSGITEVYNRAEKELGADLLKPISGQIDELIKKGESGVIDGQAAYNIKRTLDRIGRQNTPTAHHALELKGELMDALNRSLGDEKAAKFAKVREQYSNMLALEKLAKNGVEGELSVARLANMQNINNKPLQEIADIAAQFVKPREGQHGAAQRAMVGTVGAITGGIPAVAAGAAGGRLANATLNSDRLKALMLGQPTQQSKVGAALTGPRAQEALIRSLPILATQ